MTTYHSSFIKRGYITLQLRFEDASILVNGDCIETVKSSGDVDGSVIWMRSGQVFHVKEETKQIMDALRKLYG